MSESTESIAYNSFVRRYQYANSAYNGAASVTARITWRKKIKELEAEGRLKGYSRKDLCSIIENSPDRKGMDAVSLSFFTDTSIDTNMESAFE